MSIEKERLEKTWQTLADILIEQDNESKEIDDDTTICIIRAANYVRKLAKKET